MFPMLDAFKSFANVLLQQLNLNSDLSKLYSFEFVLDYCGQEQCYVARNNKPQVCRLEQSACDFSEQQRSSKHFLCGDDLLWLRLFL